MRLGEMIDREKNYLPWIRPLRSFIHYHLFPDLLKTPFWQALDALDQVYYWSSLLPYDYWKLFAQINLLESDKLTSNLSEDEELHFSLIKEKGFRPLHQLLNDRIQASLNELTEPILIRFLSAYFDQGVASNVPFIRKEGLLASFIYFAESSLVPIKPIRQNQIWEWKKLPAEELAKKLLQDIIPYPEFHQQYIREILISLKGWSGLIKAIQDNPGLLPIPRNASLLDFVTIRLMLEWSWLNNYFGIPQLCKEQILNALKDETKEKVIRSRNYESLLMSLENNLQKNYLVKLQHHLSREQKDTHQPLWSFLFCIDDREGILRRHLEKQDPRIQTFGTPGHFGFEFFLQRKANEHPIKQCPDPVVTSKIIHLKVKANMRHYPWATPKWTTWAALRSLFIQQPPNYGNAQFRLVRFETAPDSDVRSVFSPSEAADRLAQVFKTIGWTNVTSPLNFVIGHHATTQNNPFFNAYGCGACSGSSGAINALIFADFANDAKIRQLLKTQYQVEIAPSVIFIAGVHDTTTDSITLFAESSLIESNEILLHLSKALEQVQKERQHDYFTSQSKIENSTDLYEFFWKQGHAIFQVRPEYGHNSVAFCYIGDREKVKGFSFDRKAFLQSYDFSSDSSGDQLESILKAVIPVCAGINLDYFFSRQNLLAGAGTKLSLNINGLFSVTNGVEEDILPGICYQMVERHIPSRMNFIIEQDPQLIISVLKRHESLWNYIKNEWAFLWCYWGRRLLKFHKDQWQSLEESL
jgi:uncharacterized protein YbcC (UPF0753/DUF2309 family)